MHVEWEAGDIDDMVRDDAMDDARAQLSEFAEYDREQRELEAWRMVAEMRGEVGWSHAVGKWFATAPTGEIGTYANCPDWYTAFGVEPLAVVEDAHRHWVDRGRPPWPFELKCDPDAEPDPRDGDGPFWPEEGAP